MPKFRVTLARTSTEIVEADNPYMAAIVARDLYGGDSTVVDVTNAGNRATSTSGLKATATKKAAKQSPPAKKKRRPMSPEARARLAQNLVKARAARAAKAKKAKKAGKRATKRT